MILKALKMFVSSQGMCVHLAHIGLVSTICFIGIRYAEGKTPQETMT